MGGERRSKSMFGRVKMEKECVWESKGGERVCRGGEREGERYKL